EPLASEHAEESRGYDSLADAGAGAGDEDAAHHGVTLVAARCTADAMLSAARSRSASSCARVTDRRSRSVPGGTVGGRMPVAIMPASKTSCATRMTTSLPPRRTGRICDA